MRSSPSTPFLLQPQHFILPVMLTYVVPQLMPFPASITWMIYDQLLRTLCNGIIRSLLAFTICQAGEYLHPTVSYLSKIFTSGTDYGCNLNHTIINRWSSPHRPSMPFLVRVTGNSEDLTLF